MVPRHIYLVHCSVEGKKCRDYVTYKADSSGVLIPSRTAVPIWEQSSQILSGLSPKRDRGTKRINLVCAFLLLNSFVRSGSWGLSAKPQTLLHQRSDGLGRALLPGMSPPADSERYPYSRTRFSTDRNANICRPRESKEGPKNSEAPKYNKKKKKVECRTRDSFR